MFLTGTGMWSAMVMCMFPFLPGDLAKIILASFLVAKYRKTLIERD
jgi:biotin transport system substrate-specific component